MNRRKFLGALAGLAVAGAGGTAAWADAVSDFYRGRTVTLIVAAAPGGGADLYARAFVKYFAKHLPGTPNVVVSNLPGAGGLAAAAQLQKSSPRDGSVIGALQRNNLFLPLVSAGDVGFDPRKVSWIGSLNKESYVLVTWETSHVKTIDDLFSKPLIIGATSFNNENRTFPALVNDHLAGKMEIISGYKGNDEIALAMERGEVQGRFVTGTSLLGGNEANWIKEGKLNVIAQMAMEPNPSVPPSPLFMDYLKDPKAKQLFEFMLKPLQAGRPFAAPPEVPADRLAALRKAFVDTANDGNFKAELEKQSATVEFIDGAAIEDIVANLYATPPETLDKVKALLTPK